MEKPHLFLNIDFPVSAWAAGRGILVPALAGKSGKGWVSVMLGTLLRNQKISRLQNELIIEEIRVTHDIKCVSRLSGLFYFGDLMSASRAAETWKRSFNLKYLTEIQILEDSPTSKLDSNWYTYAPRDDQGKFMMEDIGWVDRYLNGEPLPTREPLWEYITESRIAILNIDLRKKAVDIIQDNFPESMALFEIARAGAWIGYDIGNLASFIAKTPNGYQGSWYMDMRVADNSEFLEKLNQPGAIVNHHVFIEPLAKGIFGKIPDLQQFGWSQNTLDERKAIK
jgi:hypothetical protein